MSAGAGSNGIFDQYTTLQWIAAGIVAVLTFPIGLAVPAYFYMALVNRWTASVSTVRTSGMKRETADALCRRFPASRRKQSS